MKNKFNNKKVVTADGVFDSTHEYQRWQYLKTLEKAGSIRDLRRQVTYELIPAQNEYYARYGKAGQRLKDGKRCLEKACCYVADFVYYDCFKHEEVVEDAKGYQNPSSAAYAQFVIKRKLMLWIHGIRIYET